MNKLLAALIAAAIASVAAAQTAPPLTTSKERQKAVQSTTEASANANTGATTAKQQTVNVQKSKQASKLSKEERAKIANDATRSNVSPENSSGTVATAAMQKNTTAISKTTSKQNAELKTKEGKQQLGKELQTNSTP
jgi:flagellar basal body-associated protein FliL